MLKSKTRFIVLLILLFSLMIVFEYLKPKPIDWSFDFRAGSKKPNGCYVYHRILNSVLTGDTIIINRKSLPELFNNDSVIQGKAIVFITDRFDADSMETKKLLAFASSGGTVFISALGVSDILADTLGFEIFMAPYLELNKDCAFHLNYFDKDSDKFYHFKQLQHSYFNKFDTLQSCVLGTDSFNNAVLVSVRSGKGKFLFNLAPEVHSNNQLLYGNRDYALAITSYFQTDKIIWDEYKKPGGLKNAGVPTTPLRFILGNANLRMAYIVLLITFLILFLLGSKRRQKVIPLIQKPANASLEFIRIISGLYLGSADNLKMAEKKFNYFIDYLRSHYFLTSITESEAFFQWLSKKSNADIDNIKAIFHEISVFRQTKNIQDSQLVYFIKCIDDFYETAQGVAGNQSY